MTDGVILCVDDEETILTSLEMQLDELFDARFIVELAQGAAEAYEVLESYEAGELPLLVIISDWQMPQIKGDEFLIEAHRRFPHVVKIMLSGHADPAAVDNAREHADLYCFLSKPWDKDELRNAILDGIRDKRP